MTETHGATVLRHIRRLVASQPCSQQSDGQLLDRFLAERDEAAFATLVQRHGPMVLSVCRSVLRHQQDAEDVFQASFLVLARKGNTIRKHQAVSSWLHGVAYRLALKARTQATRRLAREKTVAETASPFSVDDLSLRELKVILHEELNRLPEKYRAPLLLCYVEGRTRDEAAERIGVSAGAFKKYLERGRNLLGSRLIGRGLAPSTAFFATLFSDLGAEAAVTKLLTQSTAHAAMAFAGGNAVGVSGTSAVLAEGVIRTMTITKWATTACTLLLIAVSGIGLTLTGYQVFASPGDGAGGPSVGGALLVKAEVETGGGKKSDLDRIVGVWRIASGKAQGKDLPAEITTLARFTFTRDGKTAMKLLGEGREGKFKLVGPGQIDLSTGRTDELAPGIYKFEGDNRLILCGADGPKGKRPTEFGGAEGTGHVLLVLVRAKPGEEKPTPQEIAKFKGGIGNVREGAARAISVNNLKQIGLAMHNHHDVYKGFPAHAIYSKDGKTPLLSWRVAILPFIDHADLYKQFKLDQPWDSPHNKKLIAKMPRIYEPVGAGKKGVGMTYYQVFSGPDTMFDGATAIDVLKITDGTSNTVMAVEAKNAVVWTKPADVTLPKDKTKLPAVGGLFEAGFNVLMADGSVRFLPAKVAPAVLRAMVTPAAGDVP